MPIPHGALVWTALLCPSANKAYLENESRLDHGKRVTVTNPVMDTRDLTLQLHLTADTEEQFFQRYRSFCEELTKGRLEIATKYQPDLVYRTIYLSCSQFSQFTLKLNEPNPNDRAV